MALSDTLHQITANAPAPKNRVELLLDRIEGSEDHTVLLAALRNLSIRASDLTKALRVEYKDNTVVTDNSVGEWRRKRSTDLNGL